MRYSAGKNWFIFASAALGVFGAVLPLSAQLNLGADVVTAVMESESRDKKAGDRAFAAKDYAVAASFYGKYLEDARKAGSQENTRDAYERLLDALVLGRMPDLAEKTLQDYETAFPGANPLSLSMWRGDILSQRGRYAEAQKIYERILPALASKDPRRMRTLFSYGFVLERLKAYKSAAKVYNILYQQIGASALGKLAFERCVLCTAAAGEPRQALDLLLSYPPNSDSKDFAAYRLLNAYILLKAEGVDAASGAWQALLRDLKGEREPLTYLIASSYGDAFAVTKNYALALDSYRAAFNAAAGKQEAFDTLERIIQVFSRIGDRQKAAALAVKQLELFKNSLVSADTKLNTARLLEESGNTEGALQLYESVYSNINSSPEKKREALRRYGMLQGAGNRFREAEKLIRSYYRGATEADGEFLIGEVLVAHGKVDRYIAVYREIAKKWPALAPRALYLAASAALDAKEADKTLALVNELKKLNLPEPEKDNILFMEASADESKGLLKEARELYKKFLAAAKKGNGLVPQALYSAASLAFSSKEPAEAVTMYLRIVREYPKDPLAPRAAFWLIHVYYSMGDEIAAERETWLLAERHPDSEYAVNAIFRLASHYADAGSSSRAEAALDKLMKNEKFPQIQARAIFEKALQNYKNKESNAALKLLNELYERFPETNCIGDAYYLHGDILRGDGNFSAAIPYYAKAAETLPGSIIECAALGSIGDCMFALATSESSRSREDLETAVSYYRKLLQQENCPPQLQMMAVYKIGRCIGMLGNDESAADYYKQLLYKLPAAEVDLRPVETVWCVKAAEALFDIALHNPLRPTIEDAKFALHWLLDARLIDRRTAEERFEKLKQQKFNP